MEAACVGGFELCIVHGNPRALLQAEGDRVPVGTSILTMAHSDCSSTTMKPTRQHVDTSAVRCSVCDGFHLRCCGIAAHDASSEAAWQRSRSVALLMPGIAGSGSPGVFVHSRFISNRFFVSEKGAGDPLEADFLCFL